MFLLQNSSCCYLMDREQCSHAGDDAGVLDVESPAPLPFRAGGPIKMVCPRRLMDPEGFLMALGKFPIIELNHMGEAAMRSKCAFSMDRIFQVLSQTIETSSHTPAAIRTYFKGSFLWGEKWDKKAYSF
ncbi:uncharacterized protein LOC134294344 isoform X2 [Anolis carolinensis]|uniref:uncharacterized protein LOC134294344 isoform X2 n=1 Tax=Anolis carolinensis TaxID=28377 RepID=UPI002F2B6845